MANVRPARVCTRFSEYVLWLLAWCSCEAPNSEIGHISNSLSAFETLSLYWVALFSLRLRDFSFVVLYLVFFSSGCHLLEGCYFLKSKQGELVLRREWWRGARKAEEGKKGKMWLGYIV